MNLAQRLAVLLLGCSALVACGKIGSPQPPGPSDKITYPMTYPAD